MEPRQPRSPVQIERRIRFITPFTSPVTYQKQEGRLPFRHSGPVPESEPEHAMLIVGLDTSSNNHLEHHVIVKNSYGKSWGNKGYSKIAIEALTYVCIPVKKTEAELKVQVDAEAAKARAKAAEARAKAAKRKAKDMGVSMGNGKAKVDGY
ncbi:transducin/WD40 repeat-like superfamily protein [Tanacetum coccineum]